MPTNEEFAALLARTERIEAIDEIRQLASKYALAIDMRDLDAIVGLYIDDVKVTKEEKGRQALKRAIRPQLPSNRSGQPIGDAGKPGGPEFNRI
jgi:hypothetical protein